jgi:hypothetical protein
MRIPGLQHHLQGKRIRKINETERLMFQKIIEPDKYDGIIFSLGHYFDSPLIRLFFFIRIIMKLRKINI